MTSLAALAHANPAPPAFDATYHATIATVIPVLYLAYALQGPPRRPPPSPPGRTWGAATGSWAGAPRAQGAAQIHPDALPR